MPRQKPEPMEKAEFGKLFERVMRPYMAEAHEKREMKADYFAALDDIDPQWLVAGADRICRFRKKEEGLPTPGDWRDAARAARDEHGRTAESESVVRYEPASPEDRAFARRMLKNLKNKFGSAGPKVFPKDSEEKNR